MVNNANDVKLSEITIFKVCQRVYKNGANILSSFTDTIGIKKS